jgi:uncharacterized membrane protein
MFKFGIRLKEIDSRMRAEVSLNEHSKSKNKWNCAAQLMQTIHTLINTVWQDFRVTNHTMLSITEAVMCTQTQTQVRFKVTDS